MGSVLIAYCLVCWTAGLILWRFDWAFFGPCDGKEHYPPEVVRLATHLAFVSAPVWIPVIVGAFLWYLLEDAASFFRRFRLKRKCRVYQEYGFTRVNYFQLDAATRGWFDRSTRELFPLGFGLLGDYQLKKQPVSVIGRLFWRDDGTVLVASLVVEALGRTEAVELLSCLADGLCVQTASVEDPDPDRQRDPGLDLLHITCAPELGAADLYARHVQEVLAIARQRQTSVLAFESGQYQSLVIYNQRLHHRWRHRMRQAAPAPAPVLPTPRSCVSSDEMLLALPAPAAEPETAPETPLSCCRE